MTRYDEIQADLRANPRRWLVTGVAGFIGSNILEKLLEIGQEVVGLDNFSTGYQHNLDDVRAQVGEEAWQNFRFIDGDIRSMDTCREAVEGVDFVLHQAALGSVPRSINDPMTTHTVNVDGFVNVLMAARDAGVQRFVYASSSSVYGDHAGLPKVEDHIGTPLSPYAVTKRTAELYARTFYDHFGLETVGLRYFNVFGRRQDPDGAYAAVIPKWIRQMLRGEACQINGDGETSRDFCFVANAVQANLLGAFAQIEPSFNVFNVALGYRTTLNDLHRALRDGLMAQDDRLSISQPQYARFRPGDIRHSLADTTRAIRHLGYVPTHTAQNGLSEAIGWYYAQASASVRVP